MIGYGSLLSGYGLLAERRGGKSRLVARGAEPVVLRNARRGLAKPSSHGSYLAMDIEPRDRNAPITAHPDGNGLGALLLEFDRAAAPILALREEYSPEHLVRLIEMADRAGLPLAEFLLEIDREANFDLLAYRRALNARLGYTSPGYIFHPIALEDGRAAIVAIGSGYEGSGDEAVISRRRECGMADLHLLGSALAITTLPIERAGQIGYFGECVLGAIHGLQVGDLLGDFDSESEWGRELAGIVARAAEGETERFIAATSLDRATYRRRFSERPAHPALAPLLTRARLG